MQRLSLKQLEILVKEKYNLVKALRKVHPENHYQVGQPCFCPFHENHHTPAAALYDDDKGQTLFCFTERKLYSVVDVFKDLMHYDIYEIGNNLWKSMSEEEQYVWLQEHGQYDLAKTFDKQHKKELSKDLKKEIELFKYRKISLNDLLEKYIIENS
jgi:hypothetical protein